MFFLTLFLLLTLLHKYFILDLRYRFGSVDDPVAEEDEDVFALDLALALSCP